MIERKYYTKLERLPKMPNNYVLVKLDVLNKQRETKTGIRMTSGKEDNVLDNTDVFHQIDRYGEVVGLPAYLNFGAGYLKGLEWDSDLEVKLGDVVWFRQVEGNMADRFEVGGKFYKRIKYDQLTVAKRGSEVIALNGHVLMEQIFPKESLFIINPNPKSDKKRGKVKYIGTANRHYQSNYGWFGSEVRKVKDWEDVPMVKKGDVVHYDMAKGVDVDEIFLESDYINTFGEKLKICQQRHINCIIMEDKVVLLGNRVLVEPIKKENKTASGLIIPDKLKEKENEGIVAQVGTGSKDYSMEVKEGDHILYERYAGSPITVKGKEYLMMSQNDIIAII